MRLDIYRKIVYDAILCLQPAGKSEIESVDIVRKFLFGHASDFRTEKKRE